jgi:hypothetical protein
MTFINRKPLVGVLSFLTVLFTMPLGHTLMILIEYGFGEEYQFNAAFLLGLIGLVLFLIGIKKSNEATATWLGFFSGVLIWTGWVEFSFVFYAHHLGIQPLMEDGQVVTKPEYLLLPSSIGILLGTLVFFFLNKETRCNFFKWFHRNLRMKIGNPTSSKIPIFARITGLEVIYILWFFYIVMLILYDNTIFGDRHFVTYSAFFIFLVWSLYLFVRLLKFNKMAPAVRYAIPTVIIFWNSVEILGRWNFFDEIWIKPEEYVLEMSLIFAAFVGVIILTLLTPNDRAIKRLEQYGMD